MLSRIIRIAVAAGALYLSAGCVRIDDLAPEQAPSGAIAFDAGSLALRDDATKDVGPKFQIGPVDEFFVYGSKTTGGGQEDVFDGTMVRLVSSLWGYDNTRFWDLQSTRYDFLAVAGPRSTAGISCNPVETGPVTARVSYNSILGECNLMAACNQRLATPDGRWMDGKQNPVQLTDPVDLYFHHLLSAVSVTVSNDRWSEGAVSLQSWRFQNIAVSGDVTIVQNSSGIPDVDWKHSAYSTSTAVLGSTFVEPIILAPGSIYPAPEVESSGESLIVDMMIPQDIGHAYYEPQLILSYTYEEPDYDSGSSITRSRTLPIPLGNVKNTDTGVPITAWEPGMWYKYEIVIYSMGDIKVNVVASKWDD